MPGEFHGQRNLVGYSPWGHKESDVAEQLTLSLSSKNNKLKTAHASQRLRVIITVGLNAYNKMLELTVRYMAEGMEKEGQRGPA